MATELTYEDSVYEVVVRADEDVSLHSGDLQALSQSLRALNTECALMSVRFRPVDGVHVLNVVRRDDNKVSYRIQRPSGSYSITTRSTSWGVGQMERLDKIYRVVAKMLDKYGLTYLKIDYKDKDGE